MRWELPTLRTERLVLRPIVDADAEAIFAACSNPRVIEHLVFNLHTSIDDSRQFIAKFTRSRQAEGVPDPFGIAFKNTPDRLIGCLGGKWDSYENRRMEFGYWIDEPFWGQGIATEAARMLVTYLFASFPIERLQARVFDGNDASARVLEKLGFTYEGNLRSHIHLKGKRRDVRFYSRLSEGVF